MSSGLAQVIAGAIAGYAKGKGLKRDIEKQDKEDAWRDEQRQFTRDANKRDADMRQGLADAVKPAQVDTGSVVTDNAGSNAFTKDADAAAMMQDMAGQNGGAATAPATRVNQTAYTDPTLANAAATEYDSTSARLGRSAAAVMPYDPASGLRLQSSADAATEADRVKREKIKSEGVVQSVRAMRTGDPAAVKRAFNAGGEFKIDGDLTVTKEKRKAPWGADVDTFTYSGTVIDSKGQRFQVTKNSLEETINALPFKDLYETESSAGLAQSKHSMSLDEIKARGAEERKTKGTPSAEDVGGGKAPSGYRWTKNGTLEAIPGGPGENRGGLTSMDRMLIDGRRTEAKKAVDAIQEKLGDRLLTIQAQKPGPAQDQYNALKAQLAEAQSEYQRWDGAMTELATAAAGRAGLGGGNAPAKPAGSEAGLKPKASGDMGAAPGARDREISQARADLEKTKDPAERKLLQDHIAQMEAQNGKYGGKPVSVASKAERDALPKGSKYIAPNGQTYIKQ